MRPLLLSATVALAAPALATASPSMIFSQPAETVWASPTSDGRAAVALRTGHARALAIEERPGRRVGTVAERDLIGLWRTTFRSDPPNAVLSGVDARGVRRSAVVTLRRAARTATGVRYRVRVLRGRLPRRMGSAGLVIDGVPLVQVAPIVRFPARVAPAVPPAVLVEPSSPLELEGPAARVVSSITLLPGASIVLRGSGAVRLRGNIPGASGGPCGGLSALTGVGAWTAAQGVCEITWTSLPATLRLTGDSPLTIERAVIDFG